MFPIMTVRPGHTGLGLQYRLHLTCYQYSRSERNHNHHLTDLSHGDVEGSLSLSKSCRDVDTVDVAVESLAEDHPVERTVELDPDSEEILLALNLQVFDLSHIGWLTVGPGIGS